MLEAAPRRRPSRGKHRRGAQGYTVAYDSAGHLKVLFQMWGSVWPKVLPHCIANVAIAASIQLVDSLQGIDLTISDESHSFMNLMVAFLLVSRITISVNRYMEAREFIGIMDKEARELMQRMAILTRRMQKESDKEWRNEVAYRTLLLYRTVMAMIDYGSQQIPPWQVPEMDPQESREIQLQMLYDFGGAMSSRSEFENSMRVPVFMAFKLRCCLDSGRDRLSAKMDELRSLKLFESVDCFMNGFYGIRKLLTTPFPFPLVQMARTFLFFYIFTVPFALLSDVSSPFAHLAVIFFLTYGFVGIELVAIELDDPFGDDPNDFNNLAMAHTTFEDTYLLVMMVDGEDYANKLREKMQKRVPEQETAADERSSLLRKP